MRPSSVQLPSPHLALNLDTEQKWLLSEITELAQVGRAAALSVLPVLHASHTLPLLPPSLLRLYPQQTVHHPLGTASHHQESVYPMADTLLMRWTGPALNTTITCMPPSSASVLVVQACNPCCMAKPQLCTHQHGCFPSVGFVVKRLEGNALQPACFPSRPPPLQEASAAFDAVDAALYEHAYTAHRAASQGQAPLPELWEVADPSVISLLTAAADERSAFEEMVSTRCRTSRCFFEPGQLAAACARHGCMAA